MVISPGSRSTPLAHTAIALGCFETYVIHDERSAGFFALGLSKADKIPAILICTSGTATANYFPAVVEASQSARALVLLTADRPLRLRNSGAPQTIDQSRLYGRYASRFIDSAPDLSMHPDLGAVVNDVALAVSRSWPDTNGPVHINVPLDEPLAPVAIRSAEMAGLWFAAEEIIDEIVGHVQLTSNVWDSQFVFPKKFAEVSTEHFVNSQSGLIVAGPDAALTRDDRDAIHQLARKLGWPVFADVLSGLRDSGEPVIPYYDMILRKPEFAALSPDVVVAFGAHPTSRALNEYLDTHRFAVTIRIQPHRQPWDPSRRATLELCHPIAFYCNAISAKISASRDSLLLEPFLRASGAVRSALTCIDAELWNDAELVFVNEAIRALPANANLVLAGSMSVRYADIFGAHEGRQLKVFGMRGANGIDGTIAHAAGIAAASTEPTLLVCGDLALLHDLNSLAPVAYFAKNLTILLIDNNGGGIFHFLPVRELEPHFDTIHATPHDLNLAAAKDLFGLDWIDISSPTKLRNQMSHPHGRARVFHVRTSPSDNLTAHSRLIELLLMKIVT